jgi:uncharacterized protein
VILVDANLLIYAHCKDFTQHPAAREWLDARLNGTARVGLPWPSMLAFLRIVTNARMFSSPEPVMGAWQQVEDWLSAPAAWIPTPGAGHSQILGRLMSHVTRATLVPDAHLAALAVEHGLTLCSTDGDFARFPGLAWTNPLAS